MKSEIRAMLLMNIMSFGADCFPCRKMVVIMNNIELKN